MNESDGDEKVEERVVGSLLQGGDVFAQRVLIGSGHQRVVAVEDAEGKMVRTLEHQTQAKPVVAQILGNGDDLLGKCQDVVKSVFRRSATDGGRKLGHKVTSWLVMETRM